jgi:transposase
MPQNLQTSETLIADKGYDSDAFREALAGRGISLTFHRKPTAGCPQRAARPCIDSHKAENMFAKLRDWRRISMRNDRCACTFFGAICIAATAIFWLGQ